MAKRQELNGIETVPIKVTICSEVIDRMISAVGYSNVVEGGKLIGKIYRSNKSININVSSYIDSGPGAIKSSTKIIHDEKYQKHVFRLLEFFDGDIEHLGFWNSHHCNKLKELRIEDINQYAININDNNQSLNYNFAMLVTYKNYNQLGLKYYLIERNNNKFIEIDNSNISFEYYSASNFSGLLNEMENHTELKPSVLRNGVIETYEI